MQHFAHHAVNAVREAVGFLMFTLSEIPAEMPANRTLKLKATKNTKKTTKALV